MALSDAPVRQDSCPAAAKTGVISAPRWRRPPMAELPTGTVTFLFTDIEGSTRLWEQHPEAMPAALACHNTLLRQAIEAHRGQVFKTVGDQFCATFSRAQDALTAAIQFQRALQAEAWGKIGSLRVRAAL